MHEPTYRQSIHFAWNFTRKNPMAWVLAVFAVILGQFGFSDVIGQVWSLYQKGPSDVALSVIDGLASLPHQGAANIIGLLGLAIIVVAVGAFVLFLSVSSMGALISYSAQWYKDNNYEDLTKSWRKGIKHFWDVAFIQVIRKLLLGILFFVFWWVLRSSFSFSTSSWTLVPQAILLVMVLLIVLVLSILSIYSLCYTVLDGKGIIMAVRKAWTLFKYHELVSLEVGVVLLLLNIILMAAVVVVSFFAFIPALLIWIAAGITNYGALMAVGLVVGVLLWLIMMVLLAAMYNSFTTSAWVYLFMKMHHEGVASRLGRWVRKALKI